MLKNDAFYRALALLEDRHDLLEDPPARQQPPPLQIFHVVAVLGNDDHAVHREIPVTTRDLQRKKPGIQASVGAGGDWLCLVLGSTYSPPSVTASPAVLNTGMPLAFATSCPSRLVSCWCM